MIWNSEPHRSIRTLDRTCQFRICVQDKRQTAGPEITGQIPRDIVHVESKQI